MVQSFGALARSQLKMSRLYTVARLAATLLASHAWPLTNRAGVPKSCIFTWQPVASKKVAPLYALGAALMPT